MAKRAIVPGHTCGRCRGNMIGRFPQNTAVRTRMTGMTGTGYDTSMAIRKHHGRPGCGPMTGLATSRCWQVARHFG